MNIRQKSTFYLIHNTFLWILVHIATGKKNLVPVNSSTKIKNNVRNTLFFISIHQFLLLTKGDNGEYALSRDNLLLLTRISLWPDSHIANKWDETDSIHRDTMI